MRYNSSRNQDKSNRAKGYVILKAKKSKEDSNNTLRSTQLFDLLHTLPTTRDQRQTPPLPASESRLAILDNVPVPPPISPALALALAGPKAAAAVLSRLAAILAIECSPGAQPGGVEFFLGER